MYERQKNLWRNRKKTQSYRDRQGQTETEVKSEEDSDGFRERNQKKTWRSRPKGIARNLLKNGYREGHTGRWNPFVKKRETYEREIDGYRVRCR